MTQFAELHKRPSRKRVVLIAFDPEDADQLQTIRRGITTLERICSKDSATEENHQDLAELLRRLTELESDMAVIRFEFESIGTKRVDALIGKYPPSKEQQSRHKANGGQGIIQYDPDRFTPALIAATCQRIVTPTGKEITGDAITADEISALLSTSLSQTDQIQLFNAAMLVDQAGSTVEEVKKD